MAHPVCYSLGMDSGERRLVATMPLHAITSTYGEEGLRARFALEVEGWPGPDQRRLNQAGDRTFGTGAGNASPRTMAVSSSCPWRQPWRPDPMTSLICT